MSGVDVGLSQIRKGSTDAIEKFVENNGGSVSPEIKEQLNKSQLKETLHW